MKSIAISEVQSIIPEGAHSLNSNCYKSFVFENYLNYRIPKIIAVSPKANIMYSMSKFVSIETSFGPILEQIKYPCLEQIYIVDIIKILPVFINILEQV